VIAGVAIGLLGAADTARAGSAQDPVPSQQPAQAAVA